MGSQESGRNSGKQKAVPHLTERRFSARQALRCLGRKGFSAPATLTGVGVGNFETARGETVAKINHGTSQVLSAKWVHQNGDAVRLVQQIVGPLFIESHRVLHTGATALLDIQAENFAVVLWLLKQCFDLIRRTWSYVNYSIIGGTYFHIEFHLNLSPCAAHVKSREEQGR